MIIYPISPIALRKTKPVLNFMAKNQLPLSNLISLDVFFIRMANYKSNIKWAADMRIAAENISDMMRKNIDINQIISRAEESIKNIYLKMSKRAVSYGERKTSRINCFDLLKGKLSRGSEYFERYKNTFGVDKAGEVFVPVSNAKYQDAITCKLILNKNSVTIMTGANNPNNLNTNLDLVVKAYNDLKSRVNPSKQDIMETAATIQWLIAQETPYKRGSDSVANLLTRSLMHSYGIKLSPLKQGVSCDFEAFNRNLNDYIKVYPALFEKNPLAV